MVHKRLSWSRLLTKNSSPQSTISNLDIGTPPMVPESPSLLANSNSFFDEINKGIFNFPDDSFHIHTVVCPTTGVSALPKMGSPESTPFYSWLKAISANSPTFTSSSSTGKTSTSFEKADNCFNIKGIGINSYNDTDNIECPDREYEPVPISSPIIEDNLSLDSIPIENFMAAQSLGCSAILIRVSSYEDGTKESRFISVQVNDLQLKSCRIVGAKKKSTLRHVSDIFLFPTLEESIDVHINIHDITEGEQLHENLGSPVSHPPNASTSAGTQFADDTVSISDISLVSNFPVGKQGKAKSLFSYVKKQAFKISEKLNLSPQFEIVSEIEGKPATAPKTNGELVCIRRPESILASTVFHVDLVSAARVSGLQWFDLIIPAAQDNLGPGPWGFSRMVISIAALYTATPSKLKHRPRTASLLSLIPQIPTSDVVEHADYLTLLQTGSSSKIPAWRRFWGVVSGSRIILYPFQHKERTLPVLTIELTNIVYVKLADPERLHQKNAFHLISDRGVRHSLYADTSSSLEKWMKICSSGGASETRSEQNSIFVLKNHQRLESIDRGDPYQPDGKDGKRIVAW